MNPKNKIAEITTNEFIIHLQQAIFDIDGTAALACLWSLAKKSLKHCQTVLAP
jgi:hypothetical protein